MVCTVKGCSGFQMAVLELQFFVDLFQFLEQKFESIRPKRTGIAPAWSPVLELPY